MKNGTVAVFSVSSRSVLCAIRFTMWSAFTYFQFVGYIIPELRAFNALIDQKALLGVSQIGLMWVPLIGYLLLAGEILSFFSIFKKLKDGKEEGLISGLIGGLVVGLVLGLSMVLVLGLTMGLVAGLIGGLIMENKRG